MARDPPFATLSNQQSLPILVTDITMAGVSLYAAMRAGLIHTGRLEDAEDELTLLPGETLQIAIDPTATQVVEMHWMELGDA